jgi:integrase
MKILEEYTNWLKVNGGSTSKVVAYTQRIKTFLKMYTINKLTEKNIINFLLLIDSKSQANTSNGYRSAIRSFLKWKKLDINVPDNLKEHRKIPITITEKYFKEEIISIIDYEFRDREKIRAILYLMFYTGIRRRELTSLKRENIDLKNRTARILYRKNREPLIVFFNKETSDYLKIYFDSEEEIENAFNINYEALKKVFQKLNIYIEDIHFHAHLLRHSFARMFLKKGGTLSQLQQLLGHRNIQSTMIYACFTTDDLQEHYNKIIKG